MIPSPTIPQILSRHLPNLMQVSETMLKAIESEPTPTGLARAFMGVESSMREAYGAWSMIVDGLLKATVGLPLKGCRLAMSDVVIMPTQRITRYHLFLSRMFLLSSLRDIGFCFWFLFPILM